MRFFLIFVVVFGILPIIMSQDEGEAAPAPEAAPEPVEAPPPPPQPPASEPEAPPPPPSAEAVPEATSPEVPQVAETVPDRPDEDLSGKSDHHRKPNSKVHDPTPWVCHQKVKPGPCRSYFKKWYYHSKTATCKVFIYGGCRGNSNSFMSKTDCEKFCRAKSKDHVDIMARIYWGK